MVDVTGSRGGLEYAAPGRRAGEAARPSGAVGPNAVIQLAAALGDVVGASQTREIFAQAGAGRLIDEPPGRMVDETIVQRLYEALERTFDPDVSGLIAYDAGRRTAEYVARNRIPAAARWMLRLLPPGLGARLLLKAILGHAWTFAGSGVVSGQAGATVLIEITDNPFRTREGQWHSGVLEGLFQGLVDRRFVCGYRHEMRDGRRVCRFELRRCRKRGGRWMRPANR